MAKNGKTDSAKLISPDDLESILTELEKLCTNSKVALRNYTITVLLADMGLRVGELVCLQMSDILQASELVTALRIRSEIAKYNIERIVPLTPRARGALHQYVNENRQLLLPTALYVFPGRDSHAMHLSVRQVEYMIGKTSLSAIGRQITPHCLRHSFATRLMQTAPMPVVQELMGHANLSSTQVYSHPTTQDLFDAIGNL